MSQPLHYLITGGAGFVGSHLTEALLAQGHRVTALDNLSTGRYENLASFVGRDGYRFAIDDITSESVLDRLASEADVIVHLAAAVGVELIVEHPVHTIETNVEGTERVLKAARRYRAKVLIASTSEAYGKGAKIPFSESDDVVLGASDKSRWAYAASKLVDEFMALAYLREYDLPVVVFRLFNTIGPRQTGRYGMVVPRFVSQALEGKPVTVYGDGEQSRCFCDVRDVVQAIIGLSRDPSAVGEVFNIGSSSEISIHDLARKIIDRTASASTIVKVPYTEAYAPGFEDLRRRVPDVSKIEGLLDWKPSITLDESIDAVRDDIARQLADAGGDPGTPTS